jgi:single-strand DNA-binding protein
VREYEGKEGSLRIAVEVEASSIGHDLSRGVAHFSRTRRAPGETAAENAGALAAAASQDNGEDPTRQDEPGLADGRAGDASAGNDAGEDGAGDGVLDERAVAEFASGLTEVPGAVPV